MDSGNESSLEEYRQLRAELLFQKASRDRTLYFAGLFVLLAIPYVDRLSSSGRTLMELRIIPFAYPAIAIGLWLILFVHVHAAFAICRISVYIECVLEPKMGVSWVRMHRGRSRNNIILSPSTFRFVVAGYFSVLFASVWLMYIRAGALNWESTLVVLMSSIFSLILMFPLVTYERFRRGVKSQFSNEEAVAS